MIYLDTDFIINYLVVQNKDSSRIAKKRFEAILDQRKIFISLLTLQEISFVLYPNDEVRLVYLKFWGKSVSKF
jgi:predicted nucleic acid-binding protein